MSKEIKLGEGYISKTYEWNEEIEQEIEKNLGIKPLKGTDEATKSDNKSDNVKSPTSPTMNARRRVGRRAPHRDSKRSSAS